MVRAVPIVPRSPYVVRLDVLEVGLRPPRRQAQPPVDLAEIPVISDPDESRQHHLYRQARRPGGPQRRARYHTASHTNKKYIQVTQSKILVIILHTFCPHFRSLVCHPQSWGEAYTSPRLPPPRPQNRPDLAGFSPYLSI